MTQTKIYKLNNDITITEEVLGRWNTLLEQMETPEDILRWSVGTFPHLYQTSALGLTGLVTIDMLSKLVPGGEKMVPLIVIDTLHLFPQTLTLLEKVFHRYYEPRSQDIHVFKPKEVETEAEFAAKYGDFLWERDEDLYDFLVKVEPAHRAYKELGVTAILTGRRRSQKGDRSNLKYIEIDELNGIVKINPLAVWSFERVQQYIYENDVPYNELLNLGYKSIGDYHSTQPVAEGEDERAGRWKGKAKTECGIHLTSKYAKFLAAVEPTSI